MSERISVGDLVVVVKAYRCMCGGHLGAIFTVTGLYTASMGAKWKCCHCGASGNLTSDQPMARGYKSGRGMSLRILKRIPPLSELERAQTEAKEPA